jgi:hypothetical protein
MSLLKYLDAIEVAEGLELDVDELGDVERYAALLGGEAETDWLLSVHGKHALSSVENRLRIPICRRGRGA